MMPSLFIRYFFLGFVLLTPARAQSPADMPGWTSAIRADGIEWRPRSLPPGRVFLYTVFFPLPGRGALLQDVQAFAAKDAMHLGTISQKLKPEASGNVLTISGAIRNNGASRILTYLAFRSGNENRLARVICEPDEKLYLPYLSEVGRHFAGITRASGATVYRSR